MANTQEHPVIWFQGAGCSGCSVSVLNSVSPKIQNVLVDEVVPGRHVSLRFHPTVMAGSGEMTLEAIEETERQSEGAYFLVVEGAVPTAAGGVYGTSGERGERELTIAEQVEDLGRKAAAVIALGTCAAFGGIPAGAPNPGGCMGVKAFFGSRQVATPVINVPGCPPHPDWFVGTLASVLLAGLPSAEDLDALLRPRAFFGSTVHENCPRRAYFDEGKFAKKLSDPGCLLELGCKGPVTHADCSLRLWNGGVNWCIGAGSPCHGCVEPGFPDILAPLYEKLDEAALASIGVSAKKGG
jgi:hydrogenase small subunit